MFIQNLIRKIFPRNIETEVYRNTDLEKINALLNQNNTRLTKLEADLEKATGGYRQMLISQNPGILPELIGGDSIEALDHSLETAKSLTDKIKANLAAKAAAEKIPAGAPPRTPPNLDNLDSHAKIIYGLNEK
jgi:hypothetical protein